MSGRARLLLLCPGQGDQHAGMFDLASSDAGAAALLAGLLPADMVTGAARFANRDAQPMIVAAALATWHALRNVAPAPALVAGYSIGELSAYGVAGALAPGEAVALAATRARLMDDCLAAHPGQALLAISGMALASVSPMLAAHGFYMAIETATDSCIAGGLSAGATALERQVLDAGARARRLPVDVASHTPYMAPAVAPFAAALRAAPFGAMTAPVLSGTGALPVSGKALAVESLSRQLAETIRWSACMDACAEAGITLALELGPGAALSTMLRTRHPHIASRSVAEFRSIDAIRRWLEREAQ